MGDFVEIAKENEARREASKFDKQKASEAANARHAVNTKTCSPQKRDVKEMHRLSTVGQVAAKAKKARATVNTKTGSPSKRDAKEMHRRSTVGQGEGESGCEWRCGSGEISGTD